MIIRARPGAVIFPAPDAASATTPRTGCSRSDSTPKAIGRSMSAKRPTATTEVGKESAEEQEMTDPSLPPESRPARIAVVGTGHVGSTFAYALLMSGLAAELVLIDANRARAEGEAMDLNHTVPFTYPTRIWAGDFSDCAGAALTVLAAGVGQK